MATFVFANFFQTTLSAAVTTGATSISVASGTGAPTIAAGQQWAIVVQSAATPSVREIMYVTAVAGAAFTVVRGQEGTTAQAWSVADNVFGTNTAGQMAAAGQLAGTQSWSGANTFTGAVAVINATPGDANPVPITQADARYAALAGLASQAFNVANATTATEAVALGQFTNLRTASGWHKEPDGTIEQWGGGTVTGAGGISLTWPIAFPNAAFVDSCVVGQVNVGTPGQAAGVDTGSITTTGANFYAGTSSGISFVYRVKGY